MLLLRRHTHHRKRAALAFAQGREHADLIGRNPQHITLLGFVTPQLQRR